MENHTTQLHDLVQAARATHKSIQELEHQLSTLGTPTLCDISLLPSIYTAIQCQLHDESLREQRLCFVFVAAYLYSPTSIIFDHSLKAGLRTGISKIIGRCKGEVSEIFAEAKFRYDHLTGFREKIEHSLFYLKYE